MTSDEWRQSDPLPPERITDHFSSGRVRGEYAMIAGLDHKERYVLVKFNSDAGALIMFGDVARKLLKMMGQTGDVPGALLARDIPPALERLRQAVAAAPDTPQDGKPADREGEPPVSLRQRAFPLIELLARAARQERDVVWEEERPLAR